MPESTTILNNLIGEKIANLRKLNDDNQLDLSKKIDISRSTISNIESGRQAASIGLLYEIARIYNTEITSLLPSLQEFNLHLELGNQKFNEYLIVHSNNTQQQILNMINDKL